MLFRAQIAARRSPARHSPSLLASQRNHLVGTMSIRSSLSQFRQLKTSIPRSAEDLSLGAVKNADTTREQTSRLYLDNVFPLKMGALDFRELFFKDSKTFLETKAHQAIPSNELPHEFALKQVFARTKDGGAIVSFSFKSTDASKVDVAKDIVSRINEYTTKNNMIASFNLQPVRAFLVKGSPFLEDMIARYPTQKIRIEFQEEAVNIEKLYSHLRPYGKIFDIALYPNPITAKDPSRYAIVQFTRVRNATSARNCLHGHYIDGTRLNILYERELRTNIVKEWLENHPRITVPLLAAIVAGVTYAVFDPVRDFFITSKITQRFNPEEYKIYRWLRNETWARLLSTKDPRANKSVWANDAEKVGKLKSWLAETPETFVVITGPKGSGKSALVTSAIEDRRNKIFIDCEDIGNGNNPSEMTTTLAKQVGYFPVFTWATSMSGLIDAIVTATTGQKSGLSTTPDAQIKSILETVAMSLREIVPSEKEARERAEEEAQRKDIISKLKALVTGEKPKYVHKGKEEEKQEDDKNIPIVVIDNYMYRETTKIEGLWDEIAEWAALLIENEIAHVVFISSNAGVIKELGKSLPSKSFSSILLSDAPTEKSMEFIKNELGADTSDPNVEKVVAKLGGRLTELELLVQKMKMNIDPETAFDDIVTRNLIEVRKYGFGDTYDSTPDWTATQFWTIVKLLTTGTSINFDELKWGPVFSGNEAPLHAMERAELITIIQKDGRANSIRPGKPVYYTVFDRLVSDSVFAASMEVESNTVLKKQSEAEITKLEDQIEKLMHIYQPNKPPKEIETRVRFLLNKVVAVQKQIEQYDANIKSAKEIISTNWVECSD